MMRASLCLCLALPLFGACTRQPDESGHPAVASAAPSPAMAAAAGPPVLSASSYGPVKFGATLAAIEKTLGSKAEAPGKQDPACQSVRFPSLPGIRFMVEDGVVTRADVEPGIANTLGLAVGDTLAQARERHAATNVGPHKYEPAGHYLTMKSPDGRAAIVMEEDGKTITKIRAGLLPSVSYVEGCL
jgi:hypothetical protein